MFTIAAVKRMKPLNRRLFLRSPAVVRARQRHMSTATIQRMGQPAGVFSAIPGVMTIMQQSIMSESVVHAVRTWAHCTLKAATIALLKRTIGTETN